MIYIFYKYEKNERIIIFALSYIEAKEALYSLNSYADHIYNLTEYKMYDIDMQKYCDILGIDVNDYDFPKIISEKEFTKLLDSGAILDKQFKDIHNTKLLTKQFFENNNSSYPAMTVTEYKKTLEELGNNISNHKKNIYHMLEVVGDIWVEYFYVQGLSLGNRYTAYGKSRYQCHKAIEELQKKYENKFTSYNKQELLINYFGTLERYDIKRYDDMVEFMKKNNIKKFPFTTYKEEES